MTTEMTVQELALKLAHEASGIQMIDVREPHEVAIAALPDFDVLPLSEFADWSDRIAEKYDLQTETLVICHHGIRSDQMCQWLQQQGFTNVKNITGGIDAYARIVDSTVPRY